jgi:hypothetical protein
MARKTDTFFYLSKDGFSYIVPNTDVLSSALKNLSRREYVPVKLVVPFPPDTEANKFSVLSSEASKKFVNDITCLVNNTGKGLSQSPHSACLIAHTRTRRDYYF